MTKSRINQRILVIDDQPETHRDFLQIFTVGSQNSHVSPANVIPSRGRALPHGPLSRFEVDCVEDGLTGLKKVKEALLVGHPYAVIFVKVNLGTGWSGDQTIEEMWKFDPDLQCVMYTELMDRQWYGLLERLGHQDQILILHQPFEAIEVYQLATFLTSKWEIARQAAKMMERKSEVGRVQGETHHFENTDDLEQKREDLARPRHEGESANPYLDNIIRSMADTLLVINSEMVIDSVNRSLLNLLGYEEEELLHEPPAKIFGEELAQGWILETLMIQGSVSNVETTYLAKDGRNILMSLSGSLMQDENGHIQGMVCVAQDITERKRMEEEKRQLHDQLVDTSRRLGMADVATSVLHNVGNVLNSINVSVGLMSQTLRQSLVMDIGKICKMLQDHHDDLGAYLSKDLKGKQIPGYLAQLADHLLEEHRVMVKELETLNGSTEHAKQCVSMQQGMAKAGGIQEPVVLVELMDQALAINKGLLDHQHVEVIREYIDQSEIFVDKHQVLQILVNLIRNAIQAMGSVDRRSLTLRSCHRRMKDNLVRLEIQDTGVGIQADHLMRIFTQGFTTKNDGHGFGLHSGVLLAKNMGGSLCAHSDGPGCGATFILELPASLPVGRA